MKIGIAADHAGQRLKAAIAEHLAGSGHSVVLVGTVSQPDDDYPGIAMQLAYAILAGYVERGIFCCGSGIGPAVAANKQSGIRAAVAENEWSARDAVEHVDVNMLCLGERVIGEALAGSIVDAYLSARVQGGRHERRRDQIKELESRKPSLKNDLIPMTPYERRSR